MPQLLPNRATPFQIRSGVYRETVRPAHSGVAGKPITFTAYANERVEIRGTDKADAPAAAPTGTTLTARRWPTAQEYKSVNNQSDFVTLRGQPISVMRWPAAPANEPLRPGGARIARVLSSEKAGKNAPDPGYDIYKVTFQDPKFDQPNGMWNGGENLDRRLQRQRPARRRRANRRRGFHRPGRPHYHVRNRRGRKDRR